MKIPRGCMEYLGQLLRSFPAVAIVGPRQCGKTTLSQEFVEDEGYFDLEQETDRVRLDLHWTGLTATDRLVVLDEAQTWPLIFGRLRGAIDRRRRVNGRFLILGSVSPSLMREAGDSLTGRLAILELAPFSAAELPPAMYDSLWRMGGFPDSGVLSSSPGGVSYPVWHRSYVRTMAERDLPAWGLPSKPAQTERLFEMLAAVNGSLLNASQLGASLGVSYHTIQSYLDHLEGAFLIRRLRPFHAGNIAKRLTKSPKIYWRDSGLLHALLGLSAEADLYSQPWVGASWEGWVIEQIIASRQSRGDAVRAWHFRASDGLECDLVLECEGEREVIEIKMSTTPSPDDFRKLEKVARLVGAKRQVLISRIEGGASAMSKSRWSVNLAGYLSQFMSLADPAVVSFAVPDLTVPALFERLKEAAGALRDRGVVTDETLLQRAEWLRDDIRELKFGTFQILPTRWIHVRRFGVSIPLVEYDFGPSDHSIDHARDPFRDPKESHMIEGTRLSLGDLGYFGRISEIGHTLIPEIWLQSHSLREDLRTATQHIDTLNEVWWLSRWHGIDPGSVIRECAVRRDPENLGKEHPAKVDWQFSVLGRQLTINLEVKHRRGTVASGPFEKGVYLFGDEPERPFAPSGENEINILAITAYHAGWIDEGEERRLCEEYLDQTLVESGRRAVVDCVALSVPGGSSRIEGGGAGYDRLFFPRGRDLGKKDLLAKAIFKPMNREDAACVGILKMPFSIPQVLKPEGPDASASV